jgi:cytochrome c5
MLERRGITLMRLVYFVFILALNFPGCGPVQPPVEVRRDMPAQFTFVKFLELAKAGDEKAQHLIGFMLYFGEGVRMDRAAAHHWFHLAADQGNPTAQLNLALMHFRGEEGARRDFEEAQRYLRLAKENGSKATRLSSTPDIPDTLEELADRAVRLPQRQEDLGEQAYVTFCAGCHGFNGIAAYVGAPSFAVGERMEKSDAELFRTITKGHGVMPRWENKLPDDLLFEALKFVRTLPLQYRNGIAQVLRTPPPVYFVFGPMSAQPPEVYQGHVH